MTVVDANPLVVGLLNKKKRVTIQVFDEETEQLIDPAELDLTVQDMASTVIYSDSFTSPPPGGTRIVRAAKGTYYITWGDPSAAENQPSNTETNKECRLLFSWDVVGNAGTEEVQRVQTLDIISAAIMDCIREFRGQIDKAYKPSSIDPQDFCPLGYEDGQLLEYLRGGMSLINAYQPYPTFSTLKDFPVVFKQTLFDAGMIVGINAQTLFAIDSDIEQWSDQGNAFVINHTPKLAAFNAALSQRLDKIIPQMKLHLVKSGSVKTEVGPNFRLNTLLNMSPNGATFRNTFTSR